MTHCPSSCCIVAGSPATVPPTARAESGGEVSRDCPWQARSAKPETPASVSTSLRAMRVSIAPNECKTASGPGQGNVWLSTTADLRAYGSDSPTDVAQFEWE